MKKNTNPIIITSLTVRTGRLVCDVHIPEARFRYSSPRLAAFVQDRYPDVAHHACVNSQGKTFAAVIEHTSIAHMLEHVAISLQTRATAHLDASFMGTTEWLDEASGVARIEISFRDDLEALRAFTDATQFLNMAVLTCLA